jgi:hypothetical protein
MEEVPLGAQVVLVRAGLLQLCCGVCDLCAYALFGLWRVMVDVAWLRPCGLGWCVRFVVIVGLCFVRLVSG